MMPKQSLKILQRTKNELDEEVRALEKRLKGISGTINEKRKKIQRLIGLINDVKKDFVVSEHAILRYAERVQGLDVSKIREILLPGSVKTQAETLGNGQYPIGDGVVVKIRDKVVITCMVKEGMEVG